MAGGFDFTRLRKFVTIYTVVQIFFALLLVAAALMFQRGIDAGSFMRTIFYSVGIQLALFYPLSRAARREVEREVQASALGITPEELRTLRTRRTMADVLKSAVFLFYFAFCLQVPSNRLVLSMALYSFLLTCLSYCQYFTFSAKRRMKELA